MTNPTAVEAVVETPPDPTPSLNVMNDDAEIFSLQYSPITHTATSSPLFDSAGHYYRQPPSQPPSPLFSEEDDE